MSTRRELLKIIPIAGSMLVGSRVSAQTPTAGRR